MNGASGQTLAFAWRALTTRTAWFTLAFALVDSSFLLTDRRWVGERSWTPDWAAGGLFISGPLIAGITCYLAYPMLNARARRAFGLSASTSAIKAVSTNVARGTLIGFVGHGLTLAIAVISTETARPTDTYEGAFFFVTVIPIVMYATIGAMVAPVLGRTVGPIVATLAALVWGYLGLFGFTPNVLSTGGHVGSLVGYTYDWGLVAGSQAVIAAWTCAFAGAAIVLVRRPTMTRHLLISAGGVVVVSVVIGQVAGLNMNSRNVLEADPPRTICDDQGVPTVCLNAGHTHALGVIAHEVRRALKPLVDAGATLPATYQERAPERELPAGVGVIALNPGALNAAMFDDDDLAYAVAIPSDCPAYYADTPPEDLLLVQQYVAAYILKALNGQDLLGRGALADITPEWVAGAVRDLTSCTVADDTLEAVR